MATPLQGFMERVLDRHGKTPTDPGVRAWLTRKLEEAGSPVAFQTVCNWLDGKVGRIDDRNARALVGALDLTLAERGELVMVQSGLLTPDDPTASLSTPTEAA